MSADDGNQTECCCSLLCRIVCPCLHKRCCRSRAYQQRSSDNNNHASPDQSRDAQMQRQNSTSRSTNSVPPPTSNKPSKSRVIIRALYDFDPRQNDEIAFKKGDRMEVLDQSGNSDWWTVKHMVTKKVGYAPSNYVVIDDNKPESQDWWFAIDRREADKQLLIPGNPRGTFLVRDSADKRTYALSIRNFDDTTRTVTIKHYRIHKTPKVFVAQRMMFDDLLQLVDHYRKQADGLCCVLVKACPKEPEPVPFKDFEVDRREIELSTKLGAGQFGDVWKGKLCRTVEVAVKTLKPGAMTAEDFLNEAKAMHQLRHRKLVLLMGVCTQIEPYYIITELMVNGSLLDYIKIDSNQPLITIGIIIDMAAQVADGMQYLELQKYVHRDVRAANVLVGENNTVKVADFGLARLVAQTNDEIYTCSDQAKFPIKWTAPEAAFERQFSTKSDVWSFGILLYEIITFGRVPYPGMSNMETLQFVKDGKRMAKPTGVRLECPNKFYEVMLQCWHKTPEQRPTFEFLYHFFDNYGTAAEGQYEET